MVLLFLFTDSELLDMIDSFDYIQFSGGETGPICCRHCNKILEGVRLNANISYEGNQIFCTEDCLQDYVNQETTEYLERRNDDIR
jgi:hypothetical protein